MKVDVGFRVVVAPGWRATHQEASSRETHTFPAWAICGAVDRTRKKPAFNVVVSTLDYLGRSPTLHGAVPGLERPVLAELVVKEELLVAEGARGDEHLRGNSGLS